MIRRFLESVRSVLALAVAACWIVQASGTAASPASTVWTEDVLLQPSGPAELAFLYEYQDALAGAIAADAHLLAVRAAVGFDRAPIDFTPAIGLVQPSGASAVIDHAGLRVRYRLAGTPSQPIAVAILGYRIRPGSDTGHEIEQGAGMRWARGDLVVSGDLHVREELGGPSGTRIELAFGGAVTYGGFLDYIRAGVEVFGLLPITGPRIADAPVGAGSEDLAVYAGPTVRLNVETLWLAVGVATGKLTDDGSPVLVRAVLATQL